jgi:hypothetical protein
MYVYTFNTLLFSFYICEKTGFAWIDLLLTDDAILLIACVDPISLRQPSTKPETFGHPTSFRALLLVRYHHTLPYTIFASSRQRNMRFRSLFFLTTLVGSIQALAPVNHGQKPRVNEDGGLTSRRSSFGVLASLSLPFLPTSKSIAFDNKISNKYDDRPKRRGPKVRYYTHLQHQIVICTRLALFTST